MKPTQIRKFRFYQRNVGPKQQRVAPNQKKAFRRGIRIASDGVSIVTDFRRLMTLLIDDKNFQTPLSEDSVVM